MNACAGSTVRSRSCSSSARMSVLGPCGTGRLTRCAGWWVKMRCFLSSTLNSGLSSSTDSDEPRKSSPCGFIAKWKMSSARFCASRFR